MKPGLWRSLLARLDGISNAHATTPVPDGQAVPAHRVALILIGVAFTLTTLYIGAELGLQLGLTMGVRAVVIGSVILSLMSVPAAIVGARTRLSTYMIVEHVFGRGGSRAINLVLAIVLLGWYAVTADLFGRTFFLTGAYYLPLNLPQWSYTLISSAFVVGTTIFGFKAIDRLSLLAAPLLVALTCYVGWRALGATSWQQLALIPGTQPDLATGISAVVGGMIVGVVLMPDVTRYSRSALDCTVISIAGNGIGGGGALVLAMLPALAFHELDPMKYLSVLGMVIVGFIVLVVSTWTMNAVNLYSTGLVTSTALRGTSYGRVVIVSGAIGTTFAIAGIASRLIDFLVFLGLIVPPIASVYLSDFFLLKRRDYSAPGDGGASLTNVSGLAACVIGSLVGIVAYLTKTSLTGVPTIESFVSAAVAYWLAEQVRDRIGRDRLWRASRP